MENLTVLLEKLAEKLGTTTEYLWGVLIRQAPISALTDLMYFILVVIGVVVLYKVHRRLAKEGSDGHSLYWHYEDAAIVPMFIAAIVLVIIFIICFFSLGNIVNGFLNPEYWALDEVLKLI